MHVKLPLYTVLSIPHISPTSGRLKLIPSLRAPTEWGPIKNSGVTASPTVREPLDPQTKHWPGGACQAPSWASSPLCDSSWKADTSVSGLEQSQETCPCTLCTPGVLDCCALPRHVTSCVTACQADLLREAAAAQASTLRLQLSGARSPEVAGACCGAESCTRVPHSSLP